MSLLKALKSCVHLNQNTYIRDYGDPETQAKMPKTHLDVCLDCGATRRWKIGDREPWMLPWVWRNR
jgi:hypothetical protein